MSDTPVPTLFEWIGGLPAIEKLMSVFYDHVARDPLLAPVFATMSIRPIWKVEPSS